jgi:hypothetical protein
MSWWRGLLAEKDGRLTLYDKGDYRRIGQATALAGAAVLVLGCVVGLWGHNTYAMVGVAIATPCGGIAALAGLVFWAVFGGRSIVDTGERVVLTGGKKLPFDDVIGVGTTSYVDERQIKGVVERRVRYQIRLFTREADPQARASLGEVQATMERALEDGGEPLSPEQAAEIRRKLDDTRPLLEAGTSTLADHRDVLMVWCAAERLARVLGVPLLDTAGDEPLLRSPAELDLPLGERLARLGRTPSAPGPPAQGIETKSAAGVTRVTWPGSKAAAAYVFVAAGLVGLTALVSPASDDWLVYASWGLTLVLVALGTALHALLPPGRLTLDDRRASRGRRVVGLDEVEAVRVDTSLDPRVLLLGDRAQLRMELGTPEQARWLGRFLEHHLAGRARAPEGPYR